MATQNNALHYLATVANRYIFSGQSLMIYIFSVLAIIATLDSEGQKDLINIKAVDKNSRRSLQDHIGASKERYFAPDKIMK